MSPILILAASLAQTSLPKPAFTAETTWKQTVEQITAYPAPDGFEEKMVFSESVRFLPAKGGFALRRSRILTDSIIAGQRIGVPENPLPFEVTDRFSDSAWPETEGGQEDIYAVRLQRATTYVPIAKLSIAQDRERRLPAATYEASTAKGEVRTIFRETGGITAKGLWRFDEQGRILSARIVCENAFAPGGDGSSATFTVTITAQKASG